MSSHDFLWRHRGFLLAVVVVTQGASASPEPMRQSLHQRGEALLRRICFRSVQDNRPRRWWLAKRQGPLHGTSACCLLLCESECVAWLTVALAGSLEDGLYTLVIR